ncbi:MAG: hypothetical protein VX032_01700 [SAR324 cluster bacterium]|nr:hypothetical protein [SAR324 cluster bacterium]
MHSINKPARTHLSSKYAVFSGEVATPFEADLRLTARRRLLVALHQLPAGIVLLDRSAGFIVLTQDFSMLLKPDYGSQEQSLRL